MSDSLGLQIGFSADEGNVLAVFDKISNANKQLAQQTQQSKKEVDNLGSSFKELGEGIKKALELFAVIEVVKSIDEVAKSITRVTDQAKALGVGAESIEELAFAAKFAGQDIGTVEDSLDKFSVKVGELLQNNIEAIASFKQLGLSADNLRGKSLVQQYELAASATQKLTDKNVQASAALEVFGRGFSSALALGRSDLDKNIKLFDSLNVSLTEAQRDSTKEFTNSETVLGTIYDGLKEKIVANLSGPLTELSNQLIDFINKSGGLDAVAKNVAEGIVTTIQTTIDVFKFIAGTVKTLISTLKDLGSSKLFDSISTTISDAATSAVTNAHEDTTGSNLYNFIADSVSNPARLLPGVREPHDPNDINFDYVNDTNDLYNANQFAGKRVVSPQDLIANQGNTRLGGHDALSLNGYSSNNQSTKPTPQNFVAAGAFSSITSAAEKAANNLEFFGNSVLKSNDQITAAFKAIDDKSLSDEIAKIFSIITQGKQSQADYDKDTVTQRADLIKNNQGISPFSAGYQNIDQFDATRSIGSPIQPLGASSEFENQAADLIKALKSGDISSVTSYDGAVNNLRLQSQVDFKGGRNTDAEQKTIEEIGKFATSLGVKTQQVHVGIEVYPTEYFTTHIVTDTVFAKAVEDSGNALAANAARLGAKN